LCFAEGHRHPTHLQAFGPPSTWSKAASSYLHNVRTNRFRCF